MHAAWAQSESLEGKDNVSGVMRWRLFMETEIKVSEAVF